jgi:branched-chain amino acid aminotransferase
MQYYNHDTLIYLNGVFTKATDARVDLYAQTLHYGYGVFGGLRAYHTHNNVRIFKAQEHFNRLKESCELMHLPYIWDNAQLIRDTYELLSLNRLKNAYIRPLIYVDPNMTLNSPLSAASVSIAITAFEWGAYLGEKQLRMCISDIQKLHPKSVKVEAKACGHYVNSILATSEAKAKGYDEALLLDYNGYIAQSPGANFFMERSGRFFTPKTGNIYPGVTRQVVMHIAKKFGIDVIEKDLSPEDLRQADSAFLCGTAAEIIGIRSIDDIKFPVDWHESLGATIQRTYKNLVLEKENYEVII